MIMAAWSKAKLQLLRLAVSTDCYQHQDIDIVELTVALVAGLLSHVEPDMECFRLSEAGMRKICWVSAKLDFFTVRSIWSRNYLNLMSLTK
jgi:hypothetical protein